LPEKQLHPVRPDRLVVCKAQTDLSWIDQIHDLQQASRGQIKRLEIDLLQTDRMQIALLQTVVLQRIVRLAGLIAPA